MKIIKLIPVFLLLLCYGKSMAQQIHLRSVTHKIPPYTDYWSYDEQHRPAGIISTTGDSSTVLMFYRFNRNEKGLLVSTEVKDVSYTIIYRFNYYYNSANQIIRIDKLADMNWDHKAEELDHAFYFYYDSLGRVVHLKIQRNSALARNFTFTYENGNVVFVNNADGDLNYNLHWEYDKIPNQLEAIKWEYICTTGNLELFATLFSANNPVNGVLYPLGMDSTSLDIYPEYDERGMFVRNGLEGTRYTYQ